MIQQQKRKDLISQATDFMLFERPEGRLSACFDASF